MGIIQFTAEAYALAQKALLPPGRIWSLIPTSILTAVFLASGDELARVSGRSADLMEENDARTATELLPEYERMLDLVSTGTDQERRDRIEALLIRRQGFRPSDVQVALAPDLGLAYTDVDVVETSRAQAIAVGVDEEIYRFFVYRDPLLAGTYDIAVAQVLLDKIAHSHTLGTVGESISLLCDTATDLCDRDLLGV